MGGPADVRDEVRTRIIKEAIALLSAGGQSAVTTRAVAAAANVQAPTIYRLFGDKRGLLDAIAQHALAAFMSEKASRPPHPDPVQSFRDSWDFHIDFCVANPGVFAIISNNDYSNSPAVVAGLAILRERIRRIAVAGRLRVTEDRAVALVRAVGMGTVLILLRQAEEHRDAGLSVAARDAVIAAIVNDEPVVAAIGPAPAAVALKAALSMDVALTVNERHLMSEWLERIAKGNSEHPNATG